MRAVRISAKADYAVRAALELATAEQLSAEVVARRQDIPFSFLQKILHELRRAGLAIPQRGRDGGYRLARPAKEISVADVIRAVEGPLADVHGRAPEAVSYDGAAEALPEVWIALRANVRAVLEHVTLDDLVQQRLPRRIARLAGEDDARFRR
jgi:Rrf2 family protein